MSQNLSSLDAAMLYWKAIGWTVFFSLGVVMLAFDPMLLGNLYAMPAFQREFGIVYGNGYIIPANWQSALSLGSPAGQVIGALTAGYPMDRFGRKKTFGFVVVMTSCFIFIQFFSTTLQVLLVGELLAGLTLGYYIVIAPTYASEVCPLALRGHLSAYINFIYVFGQTVANGITLGTSQLSTKWAYKGPFCLQWLWPLIILCGLFFAPESPWWLVRQNRMAEARRSLAKLAPSSEPVDQLLNTIIATDRLERHGDASHANTHIPTQITYTSCFRGRDRRRTLLVIGCYCTQYIVGVMLLGWCTYFLELAGLTSQQAFYTTFALFGGGMVATACSWLLLSSRQSWFSSRRNIWLTGIAGVCMLHLALGIADVVPGYGKSNAWAQAGILIAWNFVYDLTVGPTGYILLVELSSPRLRAKTIAIATAAQGCVGIIVTVIIPHLISPDAAGLRGKVGFVFCSTAALCWIWAWWYLPETRGKTYDEINDLFEKGTPAADFSSKRLGDGR